MTQDLSKFKALAKRWREHAAEIKQGAYYGNIDKWTDDADYHDQFAKKLEEVIKEVSED